MSAPEPNDTARRRPAPRQNRRRQLPAEQAKQRLQPERDESLERLKQEHEDLAALTRVTANAISTLDLDELLRVLLGRVREVMGADAATILLAEEGGGLRIRASAGAVDLSGSTVVLRVGEGFAGAVASRMKPVHVEDAAVDPLITDPLIRKRGIRSMLGVPLKRDGTLIGVLHVDWLAVRPCRDREVHLLEITAERCAAAIQNAQLYQEARRLATTLAESEAHLRQLSSAVEQTADAVLITDHDGMIQYVNAAFEGMTGYSAAEAVGRKPSLLKSGQHTPEFHKHLWRTITAGAPFRAVFVNRCKDGTLYHEEKTITPIKDQRGSITHFVSTARDITERRLAERQSAAEQRVLELLAHGAPLSECLDRLTRECEELCAGMICSVLLLDADGRHLRHGAAPSLPAGYIAAIDGIEIGPGVGSCGTAAHTGRTVIVADIATDPLWADFKELALSHGLRACWSVPIKGEAGRVLGTFALYYHEPRAPQPAELVTHERAAHLASLAIMRHQNQETLRQSEARLQEAQRVARLGNWDWDITTNDLYWSDEIYRIFGLPPQFGTTYPAFLERVHPLDRGRVQAAVDAAVHAAAPYDLDHRIVLPDGRERTVHETGLVIRDDTGRPLRMVGTVQDITERAAVAAQIREQADLLNKARDAIIVAGLDNRITFWSQGAERIIGWPAAEVLGKSAEQLHGTAAAAFTAAREATMATGTWHGEISLFRKDGQPVVLDLRSTLICDEAGQPKSRLHIGTDITEKKQLEEHALRAQRLESLGMLAAGITHDFNNILAPLVLATSLLEPLITDERGRNILSIIQKSANRGTGLVRQLLSFTSGVGGGGQLLQTRHLLSDVAELAVSTFPKSIQFKSDLPGDLWPVAANASQLHQVFLNLCINARDAMPQGGTLRLSAVNRQLTAEEAKTIPDARPGAFLVVEVADTGTGIPPEILERIWEPFFTTKTPDKGTGLGLSTVRGLVYQHGGFIALQSRVHHGTVFTVFLPAAETERGSSMAPFAPPALPRGNGKLILVVDDEEPVRDMVTLMLEQHGYRVLTVGDGAAALAIFATHADEIRLLLTDFQMPQLGGPELAIAIHRIRPGLPVIAMSGAGSGTVMSTPHFASAFIPKPFTLEILLTAVHEALHRPLSAPPA